MSPRRAVRILIVDDSPIVRQILAFTLNNEGFHVSEAAGMPEALQSLATMSFDLVLADAYMPSGSGIELARYLSTAAQFRSIPVLILGASDDSTLKEDSRAAGAIGWIPKPLEPQAVIGVVRYALVKRRDLQRAGTEQL
jgi:two-component system chemotaxis response regulator CheY